MRRELNWTRTAKAGSAPMFLIEMKTKPRSNTKSRMTSGPLSRAALRRGIFLRGIFNHAHGCPIAAERSPLAVDIEPFVTDLESFDGDLVPLGVEGGAAPLAGPASLEVPAQDRGAALIQQDDRAPRAADPAVHGLQEPVPEGEIADDAPLENDVRELLEAGDLAHGDVFAAGAIFDGRNLHAKAGDFHERAPDASAVLADSIDHDFKVEGGVRGVGIRRRHDRSPLLSRHPRPP